MGQVKGLCGDKSVKPFTAPPSTHASKRGSTLRLACEKGRG